jgi:hypothetical protein
VQQNTQGYRLKSTDQADLVLIFANGVAASRLSPYLGREHLTRARAHTHRGRSGTEPSHTALQSGQDATFRSTLLFGANEEMPVGMSKTSTL